MKADFTMKDSKVMKYAPAVFAIGRDYQIIFLTETSGLGWIEIAGERFTDEEAGLLKFGTIHKISIPGEKLNKARKYTVVFTEYLERQPYFPEGIEKIRCEYNFTPLSGDDFRIFQFSDTHGFKDGAVSSYENEGGADLIAMVGDINDDNDKISDFHTLFEIMSQTARGEKPLIYSRGNHDTRGNAAQLLLDYVPAAVRNGRRETFYSFRQGPLWGLVLDCGEDKDDSHPEYGDTVLFRNFRKRETEYIRSLILNKENEYAAEGVRHKIVFCHICFAEHFKGEFDIENETYDEWVKLLSEIGVDLLISGHDHRIRFVKEPENNSDCRAAKFPFAVCSIPAENDKNGHKRYVGALIEVKNNHRTVKPAPGETFMEF